MEANTRRIARALVSVSDKQGIVEFCRDLVSREVKVFSTGGTAKALREAGVAVTDVSELTGSPEIMDGRVKTLHPRVHGGILMRELAADRADLDRIGGVPIDLVVVNLYPFEATVARGAPHDEVIENIDIGGPCMIRASAKNHARVTIAVDPNDYPRVLASIDHPDERKDAPLRAELATKAFAHTAAYDTAITAYLTKARG